MGRIDLPTYLPTYIVLYKTMLYKMMRKMGKRELSIIRIFLLDIPLEVMTHGVLQEEMIEKSPLSSIDHSIDRYENPS